MKSFIHRTVGLLSLVAVSSCSSSPSSSINTAAIAGNVNHASMNAHSAIARFGTVATSTAEGTPTTVRGLTILISDKPNTCTAVHTQGSTSLVMTIPGVAVGTYSIVDTASTMATAEESAVTFRAIDRSCDDELAEPATTGTVALKNITIAVIGPGDSIVSGTIDATFAGGRLNGSFDAFLCPDAPEEGAGLAPDAGSSSTCMP